MTETNNQYDYKKQSYKKLLFIIIGLIICAVSFVTDIIVGPASLTLSDVWLALIDPTEVSKNAYVIIWSIRLPTAIMALLVGASLGIAGAGMQTILDNPLSSPYTLGISAGAGFGASLMVVVGASALEFLGVFMVPFGAFVFASLTSFFIYSINKIKNFSSETMILASQDQWTITPKNAELYMSAKGLIVPTKGETGNYQEAAMPIACGNTVATPALATP